MAFWFFLVIGSFFFLWLVSKDTATLNASVLTLIGISAATAVSSAFIDTGKRRELEAELLPIEIRSKPHAEILNLLKSGLTEVETEISKLRAAREQQEKLGTPVAAADERIETALVHRRLRLENQIEFYESPPWKAWVSDILGEHGSITFHRFQMMVWTIVLGIIFVREVYSTMAMPEFNATLLGLMGISAGTFIGFKIPDQPKR
jgi:hypothetical protein